MIILKNNFFKKKWCDYKIIFGFVNVDGNHWNLIYADRETGLMSYLDPAGKRESSYVQDCILTKWR